jgi:uncharacterized protein YndB with AHSA1/START domain
MKLDLSFDEFYPHPPEAVWRALTDPAALSSWLMPNDFQPQVGRRFSFKSEASPPNTGGTIECEVLALEPPSRMVWSWHGTDQVAPTRVEFRLEPVAGGTRLILTHTGERDPETVARVTAGWPKQLGRLRATLNELQQPNARLARRNDPLNPKQGDTINDEAHDRDT